MIQRLISSVPSEVLKRVFIEFEDSMKDIHKNREERDRLEKNLTLLEGELRA
jgi:hypothetical protein